MSSRLVIIAVGPNQPGMANKVLELIVELGGEVLETRMSVLSSEFALIMEVGGPWNVLAKLEHLLPSRAQNLNMITLIKRTEHKHSPTADELCQITVNTIEHKDTIQQMTQFFSQQAINVEEMNCRVDPASAVKPYAGQVRMMIRKPSTLSIDELRKDLEQFCEDNHLKASLNPLRPA